MIFLVFNESVTDRWTDGPTDRPTDGRTDMPGYRDARTHLKRVWGTSKVVWQGLSIRERRYGPFGAEAESCGSPKSEKWKD